MILSIIALETYRALSYQFPFMLSFAHKPFMLNVIMLNLVMLNVVMLSVVMLSVVAKYA